MKSETSTGRPSTSQDLVEPHDSRVTELGRDPRFALEAFGILARLNRMVMRNLHRDHAIELGIASPPDRAEGPLADAIQQLKSADDPDLVDRRAEQHSLQPERVAAVVATNCFRSGARRVTTVC